MNYMTDGSFGDNWKAANFFMYGILLLIICELQIGKSTSQITLYDWSYYSFGLILPAFFFLATWAMPKSEKNTARKIVRYFITDNTDDNHCALILFGFFTQHIFFTSYLYFDFTVCLIFLVISFAIEAFLVTVVFGGRLIEYLAVFCKFLKRILSFSIKSCLSVFRTVNDFQEFKKHVISQKQHNFYKPLTKAFFIFNDYIKYFCQLKKLYR